MSVGMMLGGAWMSANAAKASKKALEKIADEPGINLDSVYEESLSGQEKAMPRAQALTGSINTFNQQQMQSLLESSIPGWAQLQGKRTKNAQDLLNGILPPDVAAQVSRTAAGKAVAGGYGGSQASRNLEARDFGLTSLNLMNQGLDQSNSIIGSTPMASLSGITDSLIGTKDVLGLRSNERSERLSALTNSAVAPSWGQVFGQGLQQTGSKLMDLMAGIGGTVAGKQCWVAREVFGIDNPEWLMFRQWLIDCAPDWFRRLYIENGERFAFWISDKPIIKALVRRWMRGRIETWKRSEEWLSV